MLKEILMLLLTLHAMSESARPRSNFVIVLTDDQDVLLNGLTPMRKVQEYLAEGGVTFENAFTTTPVCCPSRSSILTGLYMHNHGTYNNSLRGGCSGASWQKRFEPVTFGAILNRAGYRTFYAGKYLNEYGRKKSGGTGHVPEGWDWWLGLVGNSVYYNYTLSVNGSGVFRGDAENDYLTDVIRDYGLEFLNSRELVGGERPFLMVLSTSAPHEPFTPAKRHIGRFSGVRAPRTPNFNLPAGETKHWLLRLPPQTLPTTVLDRIDAIYRNRWETLLAVDEMVESIVGRLKESNLLKDTYVIFTSDNGFHSGQFALPWDKRQPYESDIRIPLLISGPQIPKNKILREPVLNIDLAPTILDLAEVPATGVAAADGTSFLPILNEVPNNRIRRSFLVEYRGEGSDDPSHDACYHDPDVKLCSEVAACRCFDSRNNTYKCIRRFRDDANEMYCKFADDQQFRELYDLNQDPYQMVNLAPRFTGEFLKGYDKALECCAGIPHTGDSVDDCFRETNTGGIASQLITATLNAH